MKSPHNQPLNSRLRQDPFQAPEGYFDQMSLRVLQRTQGTAPKRLPQGIRQFPFAWPEGYFAALPARIMARLPRQNALTWRERWADLQLPPIARLAPAFATAAVVIAVGYWGFFHPAKPVMVEADFVAQVANEFSSSADQQLLIDALAQQSDATLALPFDVQATESAAEEFLLQHADDLFEGH